MSLTSAHADLGNGVQLHYLAQGRGAPIVFLHGFPEFSGAWLPQLAEFGRDHRAIAPDLRGYNLSSKPSGVENYHVDVLVDDLRRFIAQVAGGPCALVAHDWGGVCAWHLAATHPELLTRLVILNSPHPAMLYRELLRDAAQREAMRYTLLFRTPRAEVLLGENDFARLAAMFDSWEIGGETLAPELVAAYKRAWSQPGALTTMLNYYRATRLHPPGPGDPGVSEYDAPLVCATLGSEGTLAWCQGREIRTPGYPIDCVDSTGAGDAFRGAFAAGCLGHPGGDLEDVLAYANAVSALNCRALGGRGGLPTADEVEQLMTARPYS